MKLEEGKSYKAKIPFGDKPMKVHICYVLSSKAYRDRTLIIYKVFGKSKRWWHEFMCTEKEMQYNIKRADDYNHG